MVKLIMGLKGSGKTKKLVDLVRKAVDEARGDVVCIEKDKNHNPPEVILTSSRKENTRWSGSQASDQR